MLSLIKLLPISLLVPWVSAYIPASPSNDTTNLLTADSTILLRWTNQGNYQEGISREIINDEGSLGIEKGALVHYYENDTRPHPSWDTYTSTPWIAFINCDKNSSDASDRDDVFTIVRDRGAVSALLYSYYSETCVIDPEYLDPELFERVLDVYTTLTKSSARLIESQFQNINMTQYYFFNGPQLNATADTVESAINGTDVEQGYLIATVKLTNVTDPNPGNPNQPASANSSDGGGKGGTGLAMIILYAITGCVSALFCVVIITGAVRALRHPERYGPRGGDPTMDGYEAEPQSRAAGLARAVLDTFPVVKFGRSAATAPNTGFTPTYYTEGKDVGNESDVEGSPRPQPRGDAFEMSPTSLRNVPVGDRTSSPSPSRRASTSGEAPNPAPTPAVPEIAITQPTQEMIGTEICPICIMEFQDGDDLRVLPCEGKHKFHRDCVDPWLLQVSSLCPLCREDFTALENMANGYSPSEEASTSAGNHTLNTPTAATGMSRFSRYLRTAQRRRHHHQEPSHDSDADAPSS